MCSDTILLQRYVEDRDERAFADLVERHLPLVYAAALRRTGGRSAIAADVTQQVFCDLARKSHALVRHSSLIAWLYRSTRYATIDALRAERRRAALAERAGDVPEASDLEPHVDWERLRPLLDTAMDELKAPDREVVLMRYFCALPFAEIGARLGLSENAARMRAERSLDKLRGRLARRGVTSTAVALALALGAEACGAVPAGLAATVTRSAAAFAPSSGAGAAIAILMGKYSVPAISGLIAAGVTAVIWTAAIDGVSAGEMEALRAENARLTRAAAPGASTETVAAIASEYTTQATAIAIALDRRQVRHAKRARNDAVNTPGGTVTSSEVTARGHRDHGIGTPQDAAMTFAWACDIADPDELARLVTFHPDGQEAAVEVFSGMPEEIRALYPTPEGVIGMLLAASCLEAPPPGADVIERQMTVVEIAPDRFAMRRVGSTRNIHEYVRTIDGWKYVVPVQGVRGLPGLLNSETLARLTDE